MSKYYSVDYALGYDTAMQLGCEHYGDSSNFAYKLQQKVNDYDSRSDDFKAGFMSAVYEHHYCG